MSRIILILLIFLSGIGNAKTLVFKVSNPKPHLQVFLKDTVIWRGEQNVVKAKVSGKYRIKRVTLKGGKVRIPGREFHVSIEEGFYADLLVFVEAPNGEVKLGYQRLLKIVDREIPIAQINGVQSDSVLSKKRLLKNYQLRGKLNSGKWAKIKSFEMELSNGDSIVTYVSRNDYLTIAMRNAVRKHVKHGSIVQFSNIRWVSDERYDKQLEDLMIFMNDEDTKVKNQ